MRGIAADALQCVSENWNHYPFACPPSSDSSCFSASFAMIDGLTSKLKSVTNADSYWCTERGIAEFAAFQAAAQYMCIPAGTFTLRLIHPISL